MGIYILVLISGLAMGLAIGWIIAVHKTTDLINAEREAHKKTKELADDLDKARCHRITELMLRNKDLEIQLSRR